MAKTKKDKTTPISVRVTTEEKHQLQQAAGRSSVSDYVRMRIFSGDARLRAAPAPTTNMRQLAHILAALGHSELAPTLRKLLKAARIGALPASPETEEAIRNACDATIEMRSALMSALGLRNETPS
jgi:uncharacterized protein (DUF1778 family)